VQHSIRRPDRQEFLLHCTKNILLTIVKHSLTIHLPQALMILPPLVDRGMAFADHPETGRNFAPAGAGSKK